MSLNVVTLTRHEADQVVEFMLQASGNDLSDKIQLVSSKMGILCADAGYRHFYELWDALQGATIAASRLRQKVIDELTTSYSYFYREKVHFDRLARLVSTGALPVGAGDLRIWSAGCATGEEAYNIAMTLEDERSAGQLARRYHVVGSDISSKAIATAQAGRYDVADVSRMPPHWRNLYCVRSGHCYDVVNALRRNVEFRHENVLSPRLDMPFDAVVCRNMLIYFDQESAKRFCTLLKARVKPGGYLFLGHTEIMGSMPGFTYVEPSIWQRDEADADDLLLSLALR